MARGYRPGSTRDGAAAAHLPASIPTPAAPTEMSRAMADAAIANALAILKRHKPRINPAR
ncbi:hypothetical protein [Ralstonia sp. NFACC01]|uniref:hypothetical protein n=1 Tax=Ralstonia sp. NFACC01 TaxID=1566294 RepID=UPI000B827D05|nr:hypothetical protein [Ralstonia sp. NFACC01]